MEENDSLKIGFVPPGRCASSIPRTEVRAIHRVVVGFTLVHALTDDDEDQIVSMDAHPEVIVVPTLKGYPPEQANEILSLFLRGKDRETLIGDLEEEYTTYILPKHGPRFAKFWYWWHTLASITAILAARLKGVALAGIAGKIIEWVVRKAGI